MVKTATRKLDCSEAIKDLNRLLNSIKRVSGRLGFAAMGITVLHTGVPNWPSAKDCELAMTDEPLTGNNRAAWLREFYSSAAEWWCLFSQLMECLSRLPDDLFNPAGTPALHTWKSKLTRLLLKMSRPLPREGESAKDWRLTGRGLPGPPGDQTRDCDWPATWDAMVGELGEISLDAQVLEETPSDPQGEITVVTDNEAKVLEYLGEQLPRLAKQADIATGVDIHRDSVGDVLLKLAGKRLVYRPEGERSGWTVTPAGLNLAKALLKKKSG